MSPSSKFRGQAARYGFEADEGALVVFRSGSFVDGAPVHVYLDGDGTPVLGRGRIALDPTSRSRIILDLIKADDGASALIGRPCYYGTQEDCDPRMWTNARYSQAVVAQMTERIRETLAPYPHSPVLLIGYSGGGTLAMLIAPKIERVVAVVTLAANLDTAAWTAYHNYSPLMDSLNPATMPPLRGSIRQYHFFGERDDNVPAALMQPFVARQVNATMSIVPEFDHECCWPDFWAETLRTISDEVFAGTH